MESKRTLSGPKSEEKPEKKKTRTEGDGDVEDVDIFDEARKLEGEIFDEIDENMLASEDETGQQNEVNRDEYATPGTSPVKGEKSKKEPTWAGIVRKALEPKRIAAAGTKRTVQGGGRGEKTKKRRSEKSDFLLTIFGREGQEGNVQKGLLNHLNNKIFEVVTAQKQDFLPRINFTRFQEADDKTLIGCADKESAEWVKSSVKQFDPGFEIWDRDSLVVFHTYVPCPTSYKSPQEIIQALQYTNSIPGRILPLKTEETKNGRILILGMTESAAHYVAERGGTLFCGMARITLTEMKPKQAEAKGGE